MLDLVSPEFIIPSFLENVQKYAFQKHCKFRLSIFEPDLTKIFSLKEYYVFTENIVFLIQYFTLMSYP